MGLFNLFWDLRQDDRIRAAKTQADQTSYDLQSKQTQLEELRAAVDRLALVNQALWEIVRERVEMTDTDLQAKVDEIDRRDGAADGRLGMAAPACPRCRRPNAAGRTRCLYCGAPLTPAPARVTREPGEPTR